MPIPTAKVKKIISVGDRFCKLVVIASIEEHNAYLQNRASKYVGKIYFCKCDCGKEKFVKSVDLNRGHVKSCGCYKYEYLRKRLAYGEASINEYFAKYEKLALKKELDFKLTRQEFEDIIKKDCAYCGEPAKDRGVKNRTYFGNLVANGVDRIDSNLGYVLGNCNPCCKHCNIAKNDYSLDEFKKWAIKLATNLIKESV